jgi:hypothetical protein
MAWGGGGSRKFEIQKVIEKYKRDYQQVFSYSPSVSTANLSFLALL